MTLEESDLKLLHDIANRRALLKAPREPMLRGTLAATMRRRYQLLAELRRLEEEWLNRGLVSIGISPSDTDRLEMLAPLAQLAPRPHAGPDFHHF